MGHSPQRVRRNSGAEGCEAFYVGLHASLMPEYQVIKHRIPVRHLLLCHADIINHADIKYFYFGNDLPLIYGFCTIPDILKGIDINRFPQIGGPSVQRSAFHSPIIQRITALADIHIRYPAGGRLYNQIRPFRNAIEGIRHFRNIRRQGAVRPAAVQMAHGCAGSRASHHILCQGFFIHRQSGFHRGQ